MRRQATTALAAALLLLAPGTSRAALSGYSQNFETLVQTDPSALGNEGWKVFGNVYTPGLVYLYGYGPFPAPNGGPAFSGIDVGQGGIPQGNQQLVVYSDYNNGDHLNGNLIESNVYREQTIAAADVGSVWVFSFDAKLGNLVSPSTALAFIKTLTNPGFTLTNFLTVNTTSLPTTWGGASISITITPSLVGQVLQFGFANRTTNYVPSGVFYDNVSFAPTLTGVDDAVRPATFELQAAPNPFRESTRIEYSTTGAGMADVTVYDISGRRVATLFRGRVDAGSHAATWDGRFDDGRLAPAGVYRCVLQTAAGRQARNIVFTH